MALVACQLLFGRILNVSQSFQEKGAFCQQKRDETKPAALPALVST
jgi:hypothetical protein